MGTDLTAVADGLRESEAVARLVAGLSDQQGNWQPDAPWSICQCLDHLARVNQPYAEALVEAVHRPGVPRGTTAMISPGWFGRWFVGQMGPSAQRRFTSPPKGVPAANGSIREALKNFIESHRKLTEALNAAKDVDVNRVRFNNPFLSALRFTVGTGLLVINAHDQRHLQQAERVKAAPGFP